MALTAAPVPAADTRGSPAWQTDGEAVRHVTITINKSRTFHLNARFASAVVG